MRRWFWIILVTLVASGVAGCETPRPAAVTTTADTAGQAAAKYAQENGSYKAALEQWEKTYFEPINIGGLYIHRDEVKTPGDYISLARSYEVQVRTAWVALKAMKPPPAIQQTHVRVVEAFGDQVKILGYLIDAVEAGDRAIYEELVQAQYVADERLQEAAAGLDPYLDNGVTPAM